jgi:hypothetical protein
VDGVASNSRSVNNYDGHERGFAGGDSLSLPSGWSATRPSSESYEWTIRQTSGPDWFDLAQLDRRHPPHQHRPHLDHRHLVRRVQRPLDAVLSPALSHRRPLRRRSGTRRIATTAPTMPCRSGATPAPAAMSSPATRQRHARRDRQSAARGESRLPVARQPFDLGTSNALNDLQPRRHRGANPRVNAEQTLASSARTPSSSPTSARRPTTPPRSSPRADVRQTVTRRLRPDPDALMTGKFTVVGGLRGSARRTSSPNSILACAMRVLAAAPPGRYQRPRHHVRRPRLPVPQPAPGEAARSEYDNVFPNVSLKYNILSNFDFQAATPRPSAVPRSTTSPASGTSSRMPTAPSAASTRPTPRSSPRRSTATTPASPTTSAASRPARPRSPPRRSTPPISARPSTTARPSSA